MKKHKHIFKKIGGGCMMEKSENCIFPCDDDYECSEKINSNKHFGQPKKCGARIRILSDYNEHFTLPRTIKL